MNLMNILLLAQAPAKEGAETGKSGMWSTLLMFALIFVVFYFFMIRPQSKRQKEVRKFQDSLENGKQVVTQGGIYGKIREIKDNYVVVEIADNVKIKVTKGMVFDASAPDKQEQK
ncbi:MAG: preprotein translocase subunit YajC [Prevotellaceae bacterium]|jgi:preprotein translocase subunit YajC|nr:preprotein translocase subunit YajC [Prevotellaceae bacterium]